MAKAFLIGLQFAGRSEWEVQDSLAELADLASDAGLLVAGQFVQKRSHPEPATYIGSGKALEISEVVSADDIVIFDDELSPAQQNNLSDLLEVAVIDRTQLILDIFAQRARTSEGKIQVELAQLNYLLPRLAGQGTNLSRLGGGIGTRGPGETKLETDRRRIRHRIAELRRDLEEIRRARQLHRKARARHQTPVVALVGYTNAGKSTLLKALTGEETYIADQMFATLDPTIRRWQLDEDYWVFLADTVGFIRKLPHTLVAAFRATLEEVVEADLLLHVLDASHPQLEQQKAAVEAVLKEIGAVQERINVYNKIDLLDHLLLPEVDAVAVSALHPETLEPLVERVRQFVRRRYRVCRYFFGYDQMQQVDEIQRKGRVISQEYTPEGIKLYAEVDPVLYQKMRAWQLLTRP